RHKPGTSPLVRLCRAYGACRWPFVTAASNVLLPVWQTEPNPGQTPLAKAFAPPQAPEGRQNR
ncbi:MAG TPA: hypothetical protein P5228_04245, partial [Bacteroidales bacterium]|nr:hypothetical protein [Bacteroidales bacterium]